MNKLQKYLERGLLLLIAVMPFHAFLSVWLGSLVGHQNLIQAWKEILTMLLVLGTVIWLSQQPSSLRFRRFKEPTVYFSALFIGIALIVTVLARPGLTAAIFGLKTDVEFLILFAVALAVGNKRTARRAITLSLITGPWSQP